MAKILYFLYAREGDNKAALESENSARPVQNHGMTICEFEVAAEFGNTKMHEHIPFCWLLLGRVGLKEKFLSLLIAGLIIPGIGIWQASHSEQAQLPATVNPHVETPAKPLVAPTATTVPSTGSTHDRLEQAQVEYYGAQVQKIKASNWISEYGTILGAMVAAIVGFVTLFCNLLATLRGQKDARRTQKEILTATRQSQDDARRNQQDIQFYEALKRLGDKDSAMVRAGAVGLLSQMALQDPGRERFLTTAANQLCEALMLEENPTVIRGVVGALERFSEVVPDDIIKNLIPLNKKLQEPFVTASFEIRCYIDGPIEAGVWPHLSITRAWLNLNKTYAENTVRVLLHRRISPDDDRNLELITIRQEDIKKMEESKEQGVREINARDAEIAGMRLCGTTTVLLSALSICPGSRFPEGISMSELFLPRALLQKRDFRRLDLSRAELSRSELEGAQLNGADLTMANLEGANFKGTNLTGANLKWANLREAIFDDAVLCGAKLDGAFLFQAKLERADLTDSAWWTADFWGLSAGGVPCFDHELVQLLYDPKSGS